MQRAGKLRVLLVGIDAACERVLSPLLEEGALPNLARLFDDGVWGPLESQIPPWTASAWPSLYTGTNPGKHGVFDFLRFDGYDWEVVNASHVRRPPIWELLDHHGLESVVVNVPVTHPVSAFDGALIPGYTAPEHPDSHPPGILDDVSEELGEYRVYPAHQGRRDDVPVDERRSEYVTLTRMRGDAFRYLTDRFDPDFGFLQFQQTDTLFHDRPGDFETVRAVYEAVDREIGATIDATDPDTVVVASDHGIGPYEGYEFRVNEFLRENGFVDAVQGGQGMPTWATVRDTKLAAGESATPQRPDLLERLLLVAARMGLTSQRLERVLDAMGLGDLVRRHVPTRLISAATEQVDFPRSKAYMRSRIECGVRINLEGREPDGRVPNGEYESVRDELVERLAAVETPAGDPVFSDVARREEYFDGPETERAVDIVTVPADFDHFLSAKLSGAPFGEPSEPWNHKREGIIALVGDGVDGHREMGDAHLFDVAPTILAAFDLPYDVRMDGEVLSVVDDVGRREYPTVERRRQSTTDASIEDRLADLGYIE